MSDGERVGNTGIRYIISCRMGDGRIGYSHGCGIGNSPEDASMFSYNDAMSQLYSLREAKRREEIQRNASNYQGQGSYMTARDVRNDVESYGLLRVDMTFTTLNPPYESQIGDE